MTGDAQKFSHISVASDDEDDVVIEAGAPRFRSYGEGESAAQPAGDEAAASAANTPPEAEAETSPLPAAAKNGPSERAPTLRLRPQALTHAPHPAHASASILGRTNPSVPSVIVIAPRGHLAAQEPHPQHFDGSSNSTGTLTSFALAIDSSYLRMDTSLYRTSRFM